MFDIRFTHNEPMGKLRQVLDYGGITWTLHKEAKVTWYNSHRTRDYFISGAVNSGCFDVSKSRVDYIQSTITGRGININPATYTKRYVEKTETQDGKSKMNPYRICSKPQEPHPGYVYQKLLGGEGLIEQRYIWCKGVICILHKRKHEINEASNKYKLSFTGKHDKTIEIFCRLFGVDYGEIDIINGIIIDVNNIPGSTIFNIMDRSDKELILKKTSDAIKQKILI